MGFLVITELKTGDPDHSIEGPFRSLVEAEKFARKPLRKHENSRVVCAVVDTFEGHN